MFPLLFSESDLAGLKLKNRITMAPMYLGYAGEGGRVSPLLLEHYRLMAQSGVALVVVENVCIDYQRGRGADRMLRADADDCMEDLARLAATIKGGGALAGLQLNHAGRFASVDDPVAPSAVETFGRRPRPLSRAEIDEIIEQFAAAAWRVKRAGFDLVELHGGTGYLLSQFVSPRTNKREDDYGGSVDNRMKFPLAVMAAVKAVVGDFPVGYRFLAEEWLPDGLGLAESRVFARALAAAGAAYLSVMGGTHESFFLPEVVERSKQPGFMVELAAAIKNEVEVAVITAGRINIGGLAESILAESKADLIGLARVLWADPEWPEKVRQGREEEIIPCKPGCDACMQQVMQGKAALCVGWPKAKLTAWKAKLTATGKK